MKNYSYIIVFIILLMCIVGGVFFTCDNFVNEINDIKDYWVLILSLILVAYCSLIEKPLTIVKYVITSNIFVISLQLIGSLLALYGMLQYFGCVVSNNISFKMTGPFENPAGFVTVQAILFPLSFYFCVDRNIFSIITASLICVSIVMCGSRTGVLSILTASCAIIYIRTGVIKYLIKHKNVLVGIIFGIICLLIFMYIAKKDSAVGRLYIWRVCFDMIKDKPMFGFGPYGIKAYFMDYQARYFELHPYSVYSWLADNITHPFNEYIKLTVNYGIFGLMVAVVLMFVVFRHIISLKKDYAGILLAEVLSLFMLSQFSYPFEYSITWLVTGLILIHLLPESDKCLSGSKNAFCFIRCFVVVSAFVVICVSCRKMYLDTKWKEMSDLCLRGNTCKMLPFYAKMKPEKKYDPYFLYNYSAELNIAGKYSESIDVIHEYMHKRNDYQVQLLLADNYLNYKDTLRAIEIYNKASNMIPCRFVPIGNAMILYEAIGDTLNAERLAKIILNKPIKVKSETVDEFVRLAGNILYQ